MRSDPLAITASRTVLEVPVPDADPLALLTRRTFNPERVVPELVAGASFAHVSILGPLPPPDEIGDSILVPLAETSSRMKAFRFKLATLRVFAGGVAYLAPEPGKPFRELMSACSKVVFERPDVPEERATPHVTLAFRAETTERLASLEALLRPLLPLTTRASEVDLVFVESSRRTLIRRFPLRG